MGRMRSLLKIPSNHTVLKHSLISIAVYIQKKHKGTIRKTRQAKEFENVRKAQRNFLELLHEELEDITLVQYWMIGNPLQEGVRLHIPIWILQGSVQVIRSEIRACFTVFICWHDRFWIFLQFAENEFPLRRKETNKKEKKKMKDYIMNPKSTGARKYVVVPRFPMQA
ncbi:hypothetical protein SADUNF_Sadunf19G0050000 [Salix dunnii]|uniref:Uncharacterized protein n=1 Tax=Salix dunnii TaxID=1413687 RepID=A0A835J227_9ROSI|nr:hypothetical protein SADUNF_Sadunf19G0050000 [Salix dunnii]